MAPIPQELQAHWPRALSADNTQNNQSILQHVYFIAAVALALLLVLWRFIVLRRANRPRTDFFPFCRRTVDPLPGGGIYEPSYEPSGPGLPLVPMGAARRSSRRHVRAADTDAFGRRLGRPDDPNWDGKDVLPAYDNVGSPPRYENLNQVVPGLLAPDQQSMVPPATAPAVENNGTVAQHSEVAYYGSPCHAEEDPGAESRLNTLTPGPSMGPLSPPPAYLGPRR